MNQASIAGPGAWTDCTIRIVVLMPFPPHVPIAKVIPKTLRDSFRTCVIGFDSAGSLPAIGHTELGFV